MNKLKITALTLALIIGISTVTPKSAVFASQLKQKNQISLEEINNDDRYDTETLAVIQVTDTDLIINGEVYDSHKLKSLLDKAQEIEQESDDIKGRFAAAAGVYLIPGIGEVVLAATGAVILGGVTITAGHWAYETIKDWLNSPKRLISNTYGIPQRLLDDKGNVKLGDFTEKVSGKSAWRNPKTGYTKEKDTAGHGGRKWKIKDKNGNRKASTDENGKILSK